MLLCRRLTDCSLGQIGKHFGNRDHTTVIHACRQTNIDTMTPVEVGVEGRNLRRNGACHQALQRFEQHDLLAHDPGDGCDFETDESTADHRQVPATRHRRL